MREYFDDDCDESIEFLDHHFQIGFISTAIYSVPVGIEDVWLIKNIVPEKDSEKITSKMKSNVWQVLKKTSISADTFGGKAAKTPARFKFPLDIRLSNSCSKLLRCGFEAFGNTMVNFANEEASWLSYS